VHVTVREEELREIASEKSFYSRKILLVFGASFLTYANISVFFHFYGYLGTLPIDARWYGLLMSVFSAVPLVLRPLISPFLHTGNAHRYAYAGTGFLMASLALYSLATGFWSMLLIRGLHGFSFVLLGAALMTMMVDYIPQEKSAQFFGFLAVVVLIPNTIIPPVLPFLTRSLGGFPHVLLLFALISGLIFPMITFVHRHPSGSQPKEVFRPLSRAEVADDFKDVVIVAILFSMLLLYSSHALVFFFLDGFGKKIGIAGTGFFLTLSTAGEIGVRLLAGSLFDKINKTRLAVFSMASLAPVYLALSYVEGEHAFFIIGLLLGLGWGIPMPVFNGLMFNVSKPRLRAFNTNMAFQMFQGGFFLGPFIGAPVVEGWGFRALFGVCVLFSLASAALMRMVERRISKQQ